MSPSCITTMSPTLYTNGLSLLVKFGNHDSVLKVIPFTTTLFVKLVEQAIIVSLFLDAFMFLKYGYSNKNGINQNCNYYFNNKKATGRAITFVGRLTLEIHDFRLVTSHYLKIYKFILRFEQSTILNWKISNSSHCTARYLVR